MSALLVKGATVYTTIGLGLISLYKVETVCDINHSLWRMVTFLASEHHCPPLVPTYTALWQRKVCVSGFPSAVLDRAVGETRTRDLWITSPTFYQ